MHAGWFRSFKNLSAFYFTNSSDKAVNTGQEAAKTCFPVLKQQIIIVLKAAKFSF